MRCTQPARRRAPRLRLGRGLHCLRRAGGRQARRDLLRHHRTRLLRVPVALPEPRWHRQRRGLCDRRPGRHRRPHRDGHRGHHLDHHLVQHCRRRRPALRLRQRRQHGARKPRRRHHGAVRPHRQHLLRWLRPRPPQRGSYARWKLEFGHAQGHAPSDPHLARRRPCDRARRRHRPYRSHRHRRHGRRHGLRGGHQSPRHARRCNALRNPPLARRLCHRFRLGCSRHLRPRARRSPLLGPAGHRPQP